MPSDLIARACSELPQVAAEDCEVFINGHGETTFVDGWDGLCEGLLSQGLALNMTTNLAKSYCEKEIAVLSQFKSLAISIDTFDDELLRNVRRKVRPTTIKANIIKIRDYASLHGHGAPLILFSCGLYDKNAMVIGDFANNAIALRVHNVTFWNLYKLPDVPNAMNVYPLDGLSGEQLRVRVERVADAIRLLRANNIAVDVTGDFVNALLHRCGSPRC